MNRAVACCYQTAAIRTHARTQCRIEIIFLLLSSWTECAVGTFILSMREKIFVVQFGHAELGHVMSSSANLMEKYEYYVMQNFHSTLVRFPSDYYPTHKHLRLRYHFTLLILYIFLSWIEIFLLFVTSSIGVGDDDR